MFERPLVRSNKESVIAGVCGGIADYVDIDPTLVRLGFVALTLVNGIGLILYIALMFVMPQSDGSGRPAKPHTNGHRKEIVNQSPTHPTEFEALGSRDN